MEKVVAIVPAAGAGKRLGLGINKAFAKLAGVPLLVHCLHMLEKTKLVTEAIVVLAPAEVDEGEQLLTNYQPEYFPALPIKVVAGGKERQDSVANALAAVPDDAAYIAVHDGARPFAGRAVFERTLAVTDDASVVELLGHRVVVAQGRYENIKITTPEDLVLAEHFLEELQQEERNYGE